MNEIKSFDLSDADSYHFWTDVSIRYSDQDELGHVNNVSYTAYVEAGRTEYLLGLFLDRENYPTLDYMLANLSVDYLKECTWPGTVQVGCRLTKVGTKSVTSSYGVFKDGICRATSDCVNVFFDKVTRKSVEPPAELREKLLAELAK